MKKIKVNKETCKLYAKAAALGSAGGFSMTYLGVLGTAMTIFIPGWKNKIACAVATVCGEALMAEGYMAGNKRLMAEAAELDGCSPWPIEFVDPEDL